MKVANVKIPRPTDMLPVLGISLGITLSSIGGGYMHHQYTQNLHEAKTQLSQALNVRDQMMEGGAKHTVKQVEQAQRDHKEALKRKNQAEDDLECAQSRLVRIMSMLLGGGSGGGAGLALRALLTRNTA